MCTREVTQSGFPCSTAYRTGLLCASYPSALILALASSERKQCVAHVSRWAMVIFPPRFTFVCSMLPVRFCALLANALTGSSVVVGRLGSLTVVWPLLGTSGALSGSIVRSVLFDWSCRRLPSAMFCGALLANALAVSGVLPTRLVAVGLSLFRCSGGLLGDLICVARFCVIIGLLCSYNCASCSKFTDNDAGSQMFGAAPDCQADPSSRRSRLAGRLVS